jgi:hypothetical protein
LFQDFNDSESQFVDFQTHPFGQATSLDRFLKQKTLSAHDLYRERQSRIFQSKDVTETRIHVFLQFGDPLKCDNPSCHN